ncbi:MAG TPA: NUDIX hydrolase [Gaiellaceae bacterium]
MSEKVYSGKLIDVELRDGMEVVVHGPAAAVVAVDREQRVVLVRQARAGAGAPLLELPAGNLDDGEPPIEAAQRELREETGLHGGQWTEVASVYTTPGYCDERIHLFVARGLEEGEPDPEGSEELEVVRVPLAELPALLAEIEDAKTLAGLLLLLRMR